MKNTSQKSILKIEKMFRKFFSDYIGKKSKNFFQNSIKTYILKILITSTSQETYIQLEKMFRQKFLEFFSEVH